MDQSEITLMIFWLVKNGKDWNPAIPLVKRIFLVPDHIWPKTIKGQPALTHVIRNYVLLLVVPPLCLWWVTHIVTKALRLKILPGQQLPLFPNPPTLLTIIDMTIDLFTSEDRYLPWITTAPVFTLPTTLGIAHAHVTLARHRSPNLRTGLRMIATQQLDSLTVPSTPYVFNNCIYF